MPVILKKGAVYDVHIDKLAFGGQGVARIKDFVVFVKRAVPGQKARIQITKIKRKYAEAKIVEILEKSPDEVEKTCDHFGICGGCVWQNLVYEKQLAYKQQQVDETIVNGRRNKSLLLQARSIGQKSRSIQEDVFVL